MIDIITPCYFQLPVIPGNFVELISDSFKFSLLLSIVNRVGEQQEGGVAGGEHMSGRYPAGR